MKHENIEGIIIPRPQSWSDCVELIRSDYYRTYGQRFNSVFSLWVKHFRDPGHRFQFYFRLCQYRPTNIFARVMRRVFVYRMRRLATRHCLQIPYTTAVGYGLYLGHSHGVIINPGAVIGNNVNLSQFTTIGANDESRAARIHDNVYIGPGVSIIGAVTIGTSATIGAGAVVTTDIPHGVTAAGVPARVLHENRPHTPQNPWQLPDTGIIV